MTREERRTHDRRAHDRGTPDRRHNSRRPMTVHEFALVIAAAIFLLFLIYNNTLAG